MVRIRELHWRQDREDHMIQKHGVYPVEVEEAIFYDRHGYFEKAGPAQRNPQDTVYEHFGRTIEGRSLMTVLFHEEGDEADLATEPLHIPVSLVGGIRFYESLLSSPGEQL